MKEQLEKHILEAEYLTGIDNQALKQQSLERLQLSHQEFQHFNESERVDQQGATLEFDFQSFKQDLDYLMSKYIKVKLGSSEKKLSTSSNFNTKSVDMFSTQRSNQQEKLRQTSRSNQNQQNLRKPESLSPIRHDPQQIYDEKQHLNEDFYEQMENTFDRDHLTNTVSPIKNQQQNSNKINSGQKRNPQFQQTQVTEQSIGDMKMNTQQINIHNHRIEKSEQPSTNQITTQQQFQSNHPQQQQMPHHRQEQQSQQVLQQNVVQQVQQKEIKQFVDESGNQYTGEVLKNTLIKDGQGELRSSDNSIFRGTFKSNIRQGRGEHILPNGDKYSGEWLNDMKHGYGKMEFISSGIVYYGQWACGKKHGMGTMSGSKGQSSYFYNGEWKQDKQHGKGIRKYDDKSTYEGMFQNDQRCGHGKLVMRDGAVFEGEFKNDQKNGAGIMQYTDGSILRAIWINDVLQGRGELEKSNGKSIIGEKLSIVRDHQQKRYGADERTQNQFQSQSQRPTYSKGGVQQNQYPQNEGSENRDWKQDLTRNKYDNTKPYIQKNDYNQNDTRQQKPEYQNYNKDRDYNNKTGGYKDQGFNKYNQGGNFNKGIDYSVEQQQQQKQFQQQQPPQMTSESQEFRPRPKVAYQQNYQNDFNYQNNNYQQQQQQQQQYDQQYQQQYDYNQQLNYYEPQQMQVNNQYNLQSTSFKPQNKTGQGLGGFVDNNVGQYQQQYYDNTYQNPQQQNYYQGGNEGFY